MKLDDALQECTLALLRRIAASHGVPVAPETLRGELAKLVLQRLQQPGYLPGYLATLAPQELQMLQAVAGYGWTAKAFVLDRRFPRRAAGVAPAPAGGEPSISLLQKGLLFRAFAPIGGWRGEVYYVPEELQPEISIAIPPLDRDPRPSLRVNTPLEVLDQSDVAFDLFCLLSFLRRSELRMGRGSPLRADLARLEQESHLARGGRDRDRWEERWRFLLHLGLAGGWVVRQGASLKPGRGASRALSGGRAEVMNRLLERYLKDSSWSDLTAVGRVRQPMGNRRIDEPAARRILLHYLEEWTADGWTDLDAFCAALRDGNPDFLREDYSSLEWAMVDAATDAEVYGQNSWDLVEKEWIHYLLKGPLAWLGAIRWGRTQEGRALAFQCWRATGDGYTYREPRAAAPDVRSPVSIGGDLEVVAPTGADLDLVYRLEPYLEFRRREGVGLYRLTRASVLSGMEKGGSWDDLRDLLASPAVDPVPPPVLSQVEGWAAEYGRFAISSPIVVTVANLEDAGVLESIPGIAGSLQSRLGPTSFTVAPDRVWHLAQRLKEAGIHPRVDPATRFGVARSVTTDLQVLRECLFALLLARSLPGGSGLQDAGAAIRRLEAILGPEEAKEISRRVQEAVRRGR